MDWLESKEKIKSILKRTAYLLPYFLIIIFIALPWFLESGYLFLTDFVWGPKIHLDWTSNFYLFNIIIKVLSLVLSISFLQKMMLAFSLFLILVAGRSLAQAVINLVAKREALNGLIFILSLFVLFNPFVYDRALYGQLGILLAYAALLFTIAYLIRSWQDLNWLFLCRAAFFSALTLMFSAHFVFLLLPFYLLFFIGLFLKRAEVIRQEKTAKFILGIFYSFIIVVTLNINWLAAVLTGDSTINKVITNGITQQDLVAFQTVGNTPWETFSNTLLMSGFWGKEQFRYFDMTDAPGWQRSFIFLSPLILFGIYSSFRRTTSNQKILSSGLIIIFILAILLAVGIKAPATRDLTLFLHNHLPFYKGLRESQKWVAAIIPIYLLYLALGTYRLREIKLVASNRIVGGIILAAIIIMSAPSLLWGFNRQANPVNYPADWYEVENYLKENTDNCSNGNQIIFLPWHAYLRFKWTKTIVANPAQFFFSCPVVSGTNMEFGGIYDNSERNVGKIMEEWLGEAGKAGPPVIDGQKPQFIILAKEVDWQAYKWLSRLEYIELAKENNSLLLYKVN